MAARTGSLLRDSKHYLGEPEAFPSLEVFNGGRDLHLTDLNISPSAKSLSGMPRSSFTGMAWPFFKIQWKSLLPREGSPGFSYHPMGTYTRLFFFGSRI